MRKFLITAAIGLASWYSSEACQYNPNPACPTASGQSLYSLEAEGTHFAAAWQYPFGTKLKVTNLQNGRTDIVTVVDRGPNRRLKGRIIDVSRSSAEALGFGFTGLARVKVEEVDGQA